MKISTLVNALESYVASNNLSPDDRMDAIRALQDVIRLQDVAVCFDQGDMEVEVISYDDFLSLSNIALYDILGEKLRKNELRRSDYHGISNYLHKIGAVSYFTVPQYTNSCGYCIDLWRDNEEEGCNDELGHFKK